MGNFQAQISKKSEGEPQQKVLDGQKCAEGLGKDLKSNLVFLPQMSSLHTKDFLSPFGVWLIILPQTGKVVIKEYVTSFLGLNYYVFFFRFFCMSLYL